MFKKIVWALLLMGLTMMPLFSYAMPQDIYLFSQDGFSIELPKAMTLRSHYTAPKKMEPTEESVYVLANYGPGDRKNSVSGLIDPQIRNIISIRKGGFDLKEGPAVEVTLAVDSIKIRRGIPVNTAERMQTLRAIKTVQVRGISFSTYQLPIAADHVIYVFYSGVIKQRLVSFIWTVYSKDPAVRQAYSQFAQRSISSFKFNGSA